MSFFCACPQKLSLEASMHLWTVHRCVRHSFRPLQDIVSEESRCHGRPGKQQATPAATLDCLTATFATPVMFLQPRKTKLDWLAPGIPTVMSGPCRTRKRLPLSTRDLVADPRLQRSPRRNRSHEEQTRRGSLLAALCISHHTTCLCNPEVWARSRRPLGHCGVSKKRTLDSGVTQIGSTKTITASSMAKQPEMLTLRAPLRSLCSRSPPRHSSTL